MRRNFESLKKLFEIEKRIADKLKASSRDERIEIYRTMYDEVFKEVPDHPRLQDQKDKNIIAKINRNKFAILRDFVDKSSVVAEFGPGDCNFAIFLSAKVNHVYAIDISDQKNSDVLPENYKHIIYNGYELNDIKKDSVDIVFSDQVIEHLHPDDVADHFKIAKNILKSGGKYVFRTPHRFSGPHDVSGYFSREAKGFHLKEWTYGELVKILKEAGYSSLTGYWSAKGQKIMMPLQYFNVVENMLKDIPYTFRKILSKFLVPAIVLSATK